MDAKNIYAYETGIVLGMLDDLDTFSVDSDFVNDCRVLGKDIANNADNVIDIARIYDQYQDIKDRFCKKWKVANE